MGPAACATVGVYGRILEPGDSSYLCANTDEVRRTVGTVGAPTERGRLVSLAVVVPSIAEILDQEQLNVVDIGARDGLCADFRGISGCVDIVGFEPDQDECARLAVGLADGGWRSARVLPYAIAGASGQRTLYRYRDPRLDSFLLPNPAVSYSDDWVVVGQTTVDAVSLADLARAGQLPVRTDFLKIDTQGTELEILRGRGDSHGDDPILGVHVELGFAERYLGQAHFYEVDALLRNEAFTLFALEPVYFGGRYVEEVATEPVTRRQLSHCDALYLRDRHWMNAAGAKDPSTLRRLIEDVP